MDLCQGATKFGKEKITAWARSVLTDLHTFAPTTLNVKEIELVVILFRNFQFVVTFVHHIVTINTCLYSTSRAKMTHLKISDSKEIRTDSC